MNRRRVIPCLSLSGGRLVKTTSFTAPSYIGDPVNAVRIFNEKEVDEILIADIDAARNRTAPDLGLIRRIVSEAFMPVAYAGGVGSIEHARALVKAGVEKVVVCSGALERPALVSELAAELGSQSVVGAVDFRRDISGSLVATGSGGTKRSGIEAVGLACQLAALGAGEILVTDVERDGTRAGYDVEAVQRFSRVLKVPLVACGGARDLEDIRLVLETGGAAAAAAGSLFVYFGRKKAVLITYPSRGNLDTLG